METIISGRHIEVSSEVKDYVNDQSSRIELMYNKLTSTRVVLEAERNAFLVEVILHGKNIDMEAKVETNDVYISIDKAFEKVGKQLRKHMDKIQDHHKSTKVSFESIDEDQNEEDLEDIE